MKIIIANFNDHPMSFMRSAGYAFEKQVGEELAFVRRMSGYDYPKFHAYVHMEAAAFCINLHLDQKKPSYGTNHAHSADYDGPEIIAESERLKLVYSKGN